MVMNEQTSKVGGQEQPGEKDPWLAVFLSDMFPGAGHLYCGARARGVFFIIASIALIAVIVFGGAAFLLSPDTQHGRTYVLISSAASLAFIVVSIYVYFDAYKVAKRRNPGYGQRVSVPGYRKAWLAAFLSAIIPGIGQFYNRQVLKGIAFLAGVVLFAAFEDHYPAFIGAGALVSVFSIKDAFDSAEAMNGTQGRFFRQEKAIVVFAVMMICLQAVPYGRLIKQHVAQTFKIASGSMYPTMELGDFLCIGKSRPFYSSVQRGDIVVFPLPPDPRKNFVKRVIGVGGDTIQMINGELYLNGTIVPSRRLVVQNAEPVLVGTSEVQPVVYEEQIGDATYQVQYLHDKSMENGGPWQVPQDAVFVMGDNRDNSRDSRMFGTVPRDTVKGKVLKIYWSWDRETGTVRWERIGMTIH
jgi:signal peptidase I